MHSDVVLEKLFQINVIIIHEIRSYSKCGGFFNAYLVLRVEKGKIGQTPQCFPESVCEESDQNLLMTRERFSYSSAFF